MCFTLSLVLLLLLECVSVVVVLLPVVPPLPGVDLSLPGEKGLPLGQVLEPVLHGSSVQLHAQVIERRGHQPFLHLSDCLEQNLIRWRLAADLLGGIMIKLAIHLNRFLLQILLILLQYFQLKKNPCLICKLTDSSILLGY